MQIRGLVGRPRPFREIVVPPRPTATLPSTFAVAALGTVTVLTATIIGVSQLGVVLGQAGHDGGRIMAVPQAPTGISPFSGFGETPAPPITIPPVTAPPGTTSPDTTSPDTRVGDATDRSNTGSAVAAAAVHARPPAGVRYRPVMVVSATLTAPLARAVANTPVTVVSATLTAPLARSVANTPVTVVSATLTAPLARSVANTPLMVVSVASVTPSTTVVSVASAYPLARVALAPLSSSPAVVLTRPGSEHAAGSSEHARHGHTTAILKHERALRDAKPAKAHKNT